MGPNKLSRDECIAIVRRLYDSHTIPEEEIGNLLGQLERDRPGIPWSDLILWPTGFPHRPEIPEPTPEQIVDRALACKPNVIIIPPPNDA